MRKGENATLEDLFPGFDTEEADSKPSVGKRFSALGKFLALSTVAGLVTSLFPLTFMGVAVQASEPAFAVWNNIPDELPPVAIAQRNTLYDIHGSAFAQIWTEDRIAVKSLDDISPFAKNALIDTEDKRFYTTPGFDYKGTVRAALSGRGGGSGITQQLVKNLQFYNLSAGDQKEKATERSIGRKVRELKTAMKYEETHTKDEILLTYFNTVAFGGPSVYGIETASRYFFGKSAKNLTLAEASALVGSAQNPSIFNLQSKSAYDSWKNRQSDVLGRMVAEGHITPTEASKASKEKLKIVAKGSGGGNCYSSKYPLYCNYVLQHMMSSERLGKTREEREQVIAKGGLQIHTYMDPASMKKVEETLKKGFGTKNRVVAPTAVVDPKTGGVLAIGQNRDWGTGSGKTTYVLPNVKSGEGSVYKIFALAAALADGWTESDLTFSSEGCPMYPGSNYDAPPGGFKNSSSCALQGGLLNYKQATAYSSNTWYVTLEKRLGVEKLKKFSKSVGLEAPDSIGPRSLSYALGSVENTPVQIAAATATFANKGVFCPATPVKSMTYNDGTAPIPPDSYNPAEDSCRTVMSPHDAGIVLKAMRANVSGEIPNAFGVKAKIGGHDTVGKSGTNENLNTTWVHLSSRYSVFTNVYDLERPVRGIDGVYYNGYEHAWHDNTAIKAARAVMVKLLSGKKNIPLDYNNPNDDVVPAPIDETAFSTVPTVKGMRPEVAIKILNNAGFKAVVSKTTVVPPKGYPMGTVASQSIAPGEKIAKGREKTIVLTIGK